MKFFALFGSILFILFAAVQYNDPDPYIWIPAYLIPAWFSYQVYQGKFPVYYMLGAAFLFTVFSVITFPPALGQWIMDEWNNQSMSMKTPSMEEARESLGSLICAVFLLIYSGYAFLFNSRKTRTA